MAGVAYAVVRNDPPDVYLAQDVDVLSRVLATEVVARTDPAALAPAERDELRAALLEERWGDAVFAWIRHTGIAVDVYTYLHIYGERDLPAELTGAQLQFIRLFQDSPGGP